jgi:hypothetical protein
MIINRSKKIIGTMACKKFNDGFLSTIYEYDVNDVVSLDMVKSINCEIGFQHGPLYTDCNIEICHRLGDDKFILYINIDDYEEERFVCLEIDEYLESVEVFAKRVLCYVMDNQYDNIEYFQIHKCGFRKDE